MSTTQRHQPLEYYTSRQTPSHRTPNQPLKLEVAYCVGVSSSMHSTTAFSGGFRYRPTTSTSFSSKPGIVRQLERLDAVRLDRARGPDPLHRRRRHVGPGGHRAAAPVRLARRRLLQRRDARSPRPSWPGSRACAPVPNGPQRNSSAHPRRTAHARPRPSRATLEPHPRSACSRTRQRPSTTHGRAARHGAAPCASQSASPTPGAAHR